MKSLSETTKNSYKPSRDFELETTKLLTKLSFSLIKSGTRSKGIPFEDVLHIEAVPLLYDEVVVSPDMYGGSTVVDHVATLGGTSLIIENKLQTGNGTTDSKLAEVVFNSDKMKINTIIVYRGHGFKEKKIEWVKHSAALEHEFFLGAYTTEELPKFIANYFGL